MTKIGWIGLICQSIWLVVNENEISISKKKIFEAAVRMRSYVRQTPIIEPGANSFGLAFGVVLKLECLQHSGSFKVRGAYNHLDAGAMPMSGVTAASGGNHGAAVAYVAQQRQIPATIFVPETAPAAKIDRIKSYHAMVHIGGANYADALEACDKFQKTSGALSIHGYDQETTIIGQGTVAEEWQRQSPDLDTIVVAVGGGGLLAGIAAWYQRDVKIVGCEPKTSCALYAARAAGKPVSVPVAGVAADSLGARQVGSHVFPLVQRYVSDCVLVDDHAIVAAQRALWDQLRVSAEPGGATALAALMSGGYRPTAGERVGVLVCGGNTTLSQGELAIK